MFRIGSHQIGGSDVFIIAEVGSNHMSSLQLAKEHIQAASEAGANAVKFQSLDVSQQYLNPSDSIRDLHKKIDLSSTWYAELSSFSAKCDILFSSSPTYLQAIDLLEAVNVLFYKIASAQIGLFPAHKKSCSTW